LKTLHLYIVRQVLATLIMTMVVFTLVLLIGTVLKEVLNLLVSGLVSAQLFAEAVGLLIPYVWVFALPMAMLTSALLVFGRFSADNELTAVRASGISLVSLVSPVLLLSLVACGASALVNMEIAPACRLAYNRLRFKAEYEFSAAQLPEGRYIKDFEGYIFWLGKNRGGVLEDVRVLYLPDKTNATATVFAPRGELKLDETNRQIRIKLFDAQAITFGGEKLDTGHGDLELKPMDLQEHAKLNAKPSLGTMTFNQLCDELRDMEGRFSLAPTKKLSPVQLREALEQLRKYRDDATTPIRLQIHRQIATSFACFGFTLLGIPLGIRVHRRETNIGFFIALFLSMVYYSLLLLGMGMGKHPELAPHIIVWLPNFLFQAIGAAWLWRANRGI
jgi:lipopolysaccharide export system permease protein